MFIVMRNDQVLKNKSSQNGSKHKKPHWSRQNDPNATCFTKNRVRMRKLLSSICFAKHARFCKKMPNHCKIRSLYYWCGKWLSNINGWSTPNRSSLSVMLWLDFRLVTWYVISGWWWSNEEGTSGKPRGRHVTLPKGLGLAQFNKILWKHWDLTLRPPIHRPNLLIASTTSCFLPL